MEALKKHTFAIVDVETTGTSAGRDRIIEIGIMRIENGEIVQTYNKLINPERSISETIYGITGITNEMLVAAPAFDEVALEIQELLKGAVFVAHNARFDYGFVKHEFKRLGINWSAKCLCSVRLSRKLYPKYKHHDLTSIIERFGFACENRHRAFDDARVIWDFMLHALDEGKGEKMEASIKEILKQSSLPQLLDEKTLSVLPDGPGVYAFYGPDDELLYIGKSRNVRTRVLSHFASDHESSKEMRLCEQTRRVEAVETGGELSALLLESEMIKRELPLYNRQLRRASELVIARRIEQKGYPSVAIEKVREISVEEYEGVLGIFRSASQAKEFMRDVSKKYMLCEQVGGPSCFYRQIGICKGACVGKEDAESYRERFEEAFAERRIRSWPYPGPIMVQEWGDADTSQAFIIDHWCILGRPFDYDAYKIFVRYLHTPANRKFIRLLAPAELQTLQARENNYEYVIE